VSAPRRTAPPPQADAGGLEPFRRRLDELDEQIARLFGERFAVCREIALYKRAHEIPMMQPRRVVEVRERYLARGAEVDLPQDFTAELFEVLIDATCRMEDELIDAPTIIDAPSADPPPLTGPSSGAPPRVDTPSLRDTRPVMPDEPAREGPAR
jgi:4-amino-4-deoxychorismate mutase